MSRQVKWPHRREDWELVQSVSQGIVALDEERVVATIMMTPYGDDAATINMVIVDAAMRGRGLGRKMMEEALARAGARTCYLVATPGRTSPLREAWALSRRARSYSIRARHCHVDAPDNVFWSESGDHACLVALDHVAYGHERSALMRLLRERAKFAVIREENAVQAFRGDP